MGAKKEATVIEESEVNSEDDTSIPYDKGYPNQARVIQSRNKQHFFLTPESDRERYRVWEVSIPVLQRR